MNNINLTMIEGYLVKDPEYKQIKDISLCKFVIGSTKRFIKKTGEQVEQSIFLEVSTWRRMAEVCDKFLKKGSRVLVTGNIRKDVWKDKDGKTQSKTYVEGREVSFLSAVKNKNS